MRCNFSWKKEQTKQCFDATGVIPVHLCTLFLKKSVWPLIFYHICVWQDAACAAIDSDDESSNQKAGEEEEEEEYETDSDAEREEMEAQRKIMEANAEKEKVREKISCSLSWHLVNIVEKNYQNEIIENLMRAVR